MTVISEQMLSQMIFQQKVITSDAVHSFLCPSSCLDYHCGNEAASVQLKPLKKYGQSDFCNLHTKALKRTFLILNF